MATFTKKKSVSKNIGKYVVKKTVTVTKTIKKRKQHKYLQFIDNFKKFGVLYR